MHRLYLLSFSVYGGWGLTECSNDKVSISSPVTMFHSFIFPSLDPVARTPGFHGHQSKACETKKSNPKCGIQETSWFVPDLHFELKSIKSSVCFNKKVLLRDRAVACPKEVVSLSYPEEGVTPCFVYELPHELTL